jgi:hypothetical protein
MYGQLRNQKRFIQIIFSWFISLFKSIELQNDGILLSDEVRVIFKKISVDVVAR